MKKVFSDLKKQIEILKSKNLIIDDEKLVIDILSRTNYYALINGYREPFLANKLNSGERSRYIDGAKFSEIYEIYKFDRAIRTIFLKYILILENNFKSAISYEFSKIYGYDEYLKLENFNDKESNVKDIFNLMSSIMNSLSRSISKNDFISYYIEKYNYVPFWVLSNTLTFGGIINFYRLMKEDERSYIAKNYFSATSDDLQSYMRLINSFRNLCAHNERFYNTNFGQDISNNRIYDYFKIECGKGDVFSLLVSLCLLLGNEDKESLLSELSRETEKLRSGLSSIKITKIHDMMGFPHNWEKIKNL